MYQLATFRSVFDPPATSRLHIDAVDNPELNADAYKELVNSTLRGKGAQMSPLDPPSSLFSRKADELT